MAKKRKKSSSLASRIARAKRKHGRYESMLQKGEYLTAPERRAFVRLGRLVQRLQLQRSAHNRKKNPAAKRTKKGKQVFRSVRDLPPGRYLLTRSKGHARIRVSKFVRRAKRKK